MIFSTLLSFKFKRFHSIVQVSIVYSCFVCEARLNIQNFLETIDRCSYHQPLINYHILWVIFTPTRIRWFSYLKVGIRFSFWAKGSSREGIIHRLLKLTRPNKACFVFTFVPILMLSNSSNRDNFHIVHQIAALRNHRALLINFQQNSRRVFYKPSFYQPLIYNLI